MDEEVLTEILGIDFEVWNSMPVFQQIQAIEENTKNIDANTKAILEELQKEDSLDQLVESPEFKMMMTGETEEVVEESSVVEEPEEVIEEVPEEEIPEEEVLQESTEEPVDYLQLIHEEMVKQNEQSILTNEKLETIVQQNEVAGEIDSMEYTYMIFILPALLLTFLISKLMKASIG